ncbi:hypothetical protein JB92DRAFT_3092835 [Gautieria morchelliformis]|nr:hypothetical protein JB92DRAFT_3092835 [Gautieria morchelliformis]
MPALPLELWRPIIAHVPEKHVLADLAQVSRFFQLEAERILYRSVILARHDDPLALTLAASRKRALLVEECSLYLPATRTTKAGTPSAPSAASLHLLNLLARMRNLHSLSLRGPIPVSHKAVSFPFRLRTFCTTEALSRPLVAFLRAQPSITRLTLLNPTLAATPLLAGALPNATALATLTPAPALAILPHRPVTHLHILAWANASFPDVAPLIGASSGPLRALMCARGLELSPADLGLVAMHMANLTFLGDVSFTEPVPAYLSALAQLPLRTLLVNRASPGLPARFSEPALVRSLGHACRDLERVAFTQLVTASYVWERVHSGSDDWRMVPVEDPCDVAADLWRAA